MTTNREREEARGCMFCMGAIAISFGIGFAFGAPFGWIAFGVVCLVCGIFG